MKLIVGLGNPGKKYEKTRHNLGFLVIDKILEVLNLNLTKTKFNGKYVILRTDNERVILAKPMNYMNNSGQFIKEIADYYAIDLNDILIIQDDKDLLVGNYKLVSKSSHAGHNGIKNIFNHFGTTEINRLRLGIGYNPKLKIVDYVLKAIPNDEWKIINEEITFFAKIAIDFIDHTIYELKSKF